MIKIFDDFEDRYSEAKRYGMSNYNFLNKSNWTIMDFSRKKIEEFIVDYDVDNDFLKSLKSETDKQHESALFELLVFTVLKNSGLSIEKHPTLENGKKPDFLIKNNPKIFLECTLSSSSYETEGIKARKLAVLKIVDQIEYFPYWICLTFIEVSTQSISKKTLLNFISKISDECENYTNDELRTVHFEFVNNGWEIEFNLFRKNNKSIKTSLGSVTEGAKFIDKTKPLLRALNDKRAGNYRINTDPYLICISVDDFSIKDEDLMELLFGEYNRNVVNLDKFNSGFFINNKTPINTSVSGVIIFRNFDLINLKNSDISIWNNPFAKNHLPKNILPFKEFNFKREGNCLIKINEKEKVDIYNLLNIDRFQYESIVKKNNE